MISCINHIEKKLLDYRWLSLALSAAAALAAEPKSIT